MWTLIILYKQWIEIPLVSIVFYCGSCRKSYGLFIPNIIFSLEKEIFRQKENIVTNIYQKMTSMAYIQTSIASYLEPIKTVYYLVVAVPILQVSVGFYKISSWNRCLKKHHV